MKVYDEPDTFTRARLQDASRAIFGNMHLLEAAIAIEGPDGGEVYGAELARSMRIADNQAGDLLRRLEAAGLLARVAPKEAGSRRIRYIARQSCFWEMCKRLAAEVQEPPKAS